MPSVNEHGKESVNFQISMTIFTIIAALSTLLLIGFVLLPAIVVLNIVLVIIAGVKAANGEFYRYPLTIRFIKKGTFASPVRRGPDNNPATRIMNRRTFLRSAGLAGISFVGIPACAAPRSARHL